MIFSKYYHRNATILLLLFILLGFALNHRGDTQAQVNTSPNVSAKWNIQFVESAKLFFFSHMNNIQVDPNGIVHLAYGGDHLYYAHGSNTAWVIETVDLDLNVGSYSSLSLDNQGYPHISYYVRGTQDLKYAFFDGNTWQIEYIDTVGNVGKANSIVVDDNNIPHVVYQDLSSSGNYHIKYATRQNGKWLTETMAPQGAIGLNHYPSLAVDSNGNPHTVFVVSTASGNNVIYFSKVDHTWQQDIISPTPGQTAYLSLDSQNNPHVTFGGSTGNFYATKVNDAWQVELTGLPDSLRGMDLDSSGNPHVLLSSFNFNLGRIVFTYAKKTGQNWTTEEIISKVDQRVIEPAFNLVIDDNDKPFISFLYNDLTPQFHNMIAYASQESAGWLIFPVDSDNRIGNDVSLALNSQDEPHVVYLDTETDLTSGGNIIRYAHWENNNWVREIVRDYSGNLDFHPISDLSLNLDDANYPKLSYVLGSQTLPFPDKIIYDDFTGTDWVQTIVEESNSRPFNATALQLDESGNPHIAYLDRESLTVRYAQWTGSEWLIESVESFTIPGDPFPYLGETSISLAFDNEGNPHLAYTYSRALWLHHAHWTGSTWQIETVEENSYLYSASLALDANNSPHIVYDNSSLNEIAYAYYDGNTWQKELVELNPFRVSETALVLDDIGNPHIAFREYRYDVFERSSRSILYYAHRINNVWELMPVDQGGNDYVDGDIASYLDMKLDSNGYPHISYHDNLGGDLKYATLSPDLFPNMIVNTQVSNVTMHTAQMSWTTDIPSSGLVEYRTVGSELWNSIHAPFNQYATTHEVLLQGLEMCQAYEIKVVAFDEHNYITNTEINTFQTEPLNCTIYLPLVLR